MLKTALLGRDIGYTRSPEIHRAISECIGQESTFDVFDVKYDTLAYTVEKLLAEYDGFFVTKPYKTEIARYVFDISGKPDKVEQNYEKYTAGVGGAINLVRSRDGAVFNTDGTGFIRALDRDFASWRTNVEAAVVLGAGGAAYAVSRVLTELGKKVYILNRTLKNTARLLASVVGTELYINRPAQLIVNCTSVGQNGEDVLRALCVLPQFEYAFDLIYTCETPFIRRCRACGVKTASGNDMLVYQAIEGNAILSGTSIETETVFDCVIKKLAGLRSNYENFGD